MGSIATFPGEASTREVTCWVRREHWGLGHASRALQQVLEQTPRPVSARVAADNVGSVRVLQRAGFAVVGSGRDFAAGRGTEVDELIPRLH